MNDLLEKCSLLHRCGRQEAMLFAEHREVPRQRVCPLAMRPTKCRRDLPKSTVMGKPGVEEREPPLLEASVRSVNLERPRRIKLGRLLQALCGLERPGMA